MSSWLGGHDNIIYEGGTDKEILDTYKKLLPAIAMVVGSNCLVVLRSCEEDLPCIAVENGRINNVTIGDPAPGFIVDAVKDEINNPGKNIIGVYYTKTKNEHTVKSVLYLIRNRSSKLIGCLCIGIDVSIPMNEFFEGFIPKADAVLADSISETNSTGASGIDALIQNSLDSAIASANMVQGISPTERNRMIVRQLRSDNIFTVRGAVNVVAKALGVSRYTIYNYLKDINSTEPEASN